MAHSVILNTTQHCITYNIKKFYLLIVLMNSIIAVRPVAEVSANREQTCNSDIAWLCVQTNLITNCIQFDQISVIFMIHETTTTTTTMLQLLYRTTGISKHPS